MPSWKKVITSGSDACLNSISVDSTTVVTNLNADKVDGCDASAFYLATNPSGYTTCTGTVTMANGADNRITTATGTTGLNGESNLTFDGSTLLVTGNATVTGNQTVNGNISASGDITASGLLVNDFAVNETLTIGSQKFYAQGNNGFSVNEDFDPSNSALQTAYHFTSGTGRETVAFTLARTGQFTDGFGIYGTSSDNTFVMFGEQTNTSFEWRKGVGIQPLDLDGGTLLAKIDKDGNLTVTGTITAQEFHTEFVSASIIYQSGSTKFGDTSDDVHSFSGSLRVTGSGNHYFTNGNVGIGTTSPSQPLTVAGNVSASALIYAPNIGAGTDNSVVILDSDGTLRTDEIDSRVWGSTLVDASGTPIAGHIPYFTDSNTITMDSGSLFWDSTNSRLGIGTSSPSHQLHIISSSNQYGVWQRTDANTGMIAFFAGDNQGALFTNAGDRLRFGTATTSLGAGFKDIFEIDSTGTNFVVNEDGDSDVDFRVESDTNANMLFVDASANRVGIGTSSPSQPLSVSGNVSVSALIYAPNIGAGVDNSVVILDSDGTLRTDEIDSRVWGSTLVNASGTPTAGHIPYFTDSNTIAMDNGNLYWNPIDTMLGIGTSSPTQTLDVRGSAVFNEGSSDVDFRVESNNNANMLFVDGGTDKVGIGTNSLSQTLNVKGSTEVSGSVISPGYTSGLLGGQGYGLALSDSTGCTSLEVDNLRVRGRLSVVEFLAQQIRATNGTLFVTSTGKVETVTVSGGGPYTACITTPTGSHHGFAVSDRIRAQRFDGFGNVYQSDLTVSAVPNAFAFTASYDDISSEPQPGYEYVRLGNSSDTDRQGGILLTSDLDDAPYIRIYDGVDEHSVLTTDSKTKVLVGNLSSHCSSTFGCLSGSGGSPNFGFYASGSAYLEGSINATGGEIGGITICNTSISASNGGFEIKSDGSATFAGGQITFETDGDITSNEYLVERSRVFGDGSDGCYTVNTSFSSVAGLFNVSCAGSFLTACLLRDAYFCNLTITGTLGCSVYIKSNGYRMFVKDTLTICNYGFIEHNGTNGSNGQNASFEFRGCGGSSGIGAANGNILGGANGGSGGCGGGDS